MNTKINFVYSDEGNYKTWFSEIVSGDATAEQIEAIRNSLIDNEFFVPSELGFRCDYDEEAASSFCAFDEPAFVPTAGQTTVSLTMEELVERFQSMRRKWR